MNLKSVDLDVLRKEITEDEGCKYEIYLDHLGLPTCGIGHLIKESDEEHGKPVGTKVSEERVNQLFDEDIKVSLEECEATGCEENSTAVEKPLLDPLKTKPIKM